MLGHILVAEMGFHVHPYIPRHTIGGAGTETGKHIAPSTQALMAVHILGLKFTDTVLLNAVRVRVLGFKKDLPATLDNALVVRLCLFLKAGDKAAMLKAADYFHRLRGFLNIGKATVTVVGQGAVY